MRFSLEPPLTPVQLAIFFNSSAFWHIINLHEKPEQQIVKTSMAKTTLPSVASNITKHTQPDDVSFVSFHGHATAGLRSLAWDSVRLPNHDCSQAAQGISLRAEAAASSVRTKTCFCWTFKVKNNSHWWLMGPPAEVTLHPMLYPPTRQLLLQFVNKAIQVLLILHKYNFRKICPNMEGIVEYTVSKSRGVH